MTFVRVLAAAAVLTVLVNAEGDMPGEAKALNRSLLSFLLLWNCVCPFQGCGGVWLPVTRVQTPGLLNYIRCLSRESKPILDGKTHA